MKYLEGFRNPKAAMAIREQIDQLGLALVNRATPVHIMEVCGTHTMAIARHGIRDILPENVELISGPGCPVCVTDGGYIDTAIALAERGCIIVSFGDMLHVPGSNATLATARAEGAHVEACYSPNDAITLARENPDREIVFLAIGFETTIAPVITLVEKAEREGLTNISLLTAFKLVPPALTALLADPEVRIDAFLCPAHVSAIIGANAYRPFTGPQGVPCVVAGFEPLDIVLGLKGILQQIVDGEARVDNEYSRVVTAEGNRKAQDIIARYLEPADVAWRGIGVIPLSGLALRPEFQGYDAEKKHGIPVLPGEVSPGCLCGNVIKGINRPMDCPMFATTCTPDTPVGPCMVSVEGTCAAYYKYSRTS